VPLIDITAVNVALPGHGRHRGPVLLPGRSYSPTLHRRGSAEFVQEPSQQVSVLGQVLLSETAGQSLVESGAGVSCRVYGRLAAIGQSHAADAGVSGIGYALAVTEAFEFRHGFGGSLLGHGQSRGQLADRGLTVDQMLEDIAVREAQIAEPLVGQLLLDQCRGGLADEKGECPDIQLLGVE
jgi:hypothetical protein